MTAVLKNRFKLVVVGDGACGKTCLLTVFKVSEHMRRGAKLRGIGGYI